MDDKIIAERDQYKEMLLRTVEALDMGRAFGPEMAEHFAETVRKERDELRDKLTKLTAENDLNLVAFRTVQEENKNLHTSLEEMEKELETVKAELDRATEKFHEWENRATARAKRVSAATQEYNDLYGQFLAAKKRAEEATEQQDALTAQIEGMERWTARARKTLGIAGKDEGVHDALVRIVAERDAITSRIVTLIRDRHTTILKAIDSGIYGSGANSPAWVRMTGKAYGLWEMIREIEASLHPDKYGKWAGLSFASYWTCDCPDSPRPRGHEKYEDRCADCGTRRPDGPPPWEVHDSVADVAKKMHAECVAEAAVAEASVSNDTEVRSLQWCEDLLRSWIAIPAWQVNWAALDQFKCAKDIEHLLTRERLRIIKSAKDMENRLTQETPPCTTESPSPSPSSPNDGNAVSDGTVTVASSETATSPTAPTEPTTSVVTVATNGQDTPKASWVPDGRHLWDCHRCPGSPDLMSPETPTCKRCGAERPNDPPPWEVEKENARYAAEIQEQDVYIAWLQEGVDQGLISDETAEAMIQNQARDKNWPLR